MNKRELRQRGKGLLALMLAFLMMLGTSMTVLAADTYYLNGDSYEDSLKPGDKLQGGATIKSITTYGSLEVWIDGKKCPVEVDSGVMNYCVLPIGQNYEVISYSVSGANYFPSGGAFGYSYRVSLKTIITTPPNVGSAGSPEAVDSLQEEAGNGGGKPHVHYFTWVTAREATKDMDGLEEYKCACGVAAEQAIIPAGQAVVKGFCQAVREAAADSRITYDSKALYTISDKMIACLVERTDVTVELTFIYQKTPYRMTIPAGSDYSALLEDEDIFYGYFCFADQIGAQIEPIS